MSCQLRIRHTFCKLCSRVFWIPRLWGYLRARTFQTRRLVAHPRIACFRQQRLCASTTLAPYAQTCSSHVAPQAVLNEPVKRKESTSQDVRRKRHEPRKRQARIRKHLGHELGKNQENHASQKNCVFSAKATLGRTFAYRAPCFGQIVGNWHAHVGYQC